MLKQLSHSLESFTTIVNFPKILDEQNLEPDILQNLEPDISYYQRKLPVIVQIIFFKQSMLYFRRESDSGSICILGVRYRNASTTTRSKLIVKYHTRSANCVKAIGDRSNQIVAESDRASEFARSINARHYKRRNARRRRLYRMSFWAFVREHFTTVPLRDQMNKRREFIVVHLLMH